MFMTCEILKNELIHTVFKINSIFILSEEKYMVARTANFFVCKSKLVDDYLQLKNLLTSINTDCGIEGED